MNSRPESQSKQTKIKIPAKKLSSWPLAISCITFFLITYWLLQSYSLLHWKILTDHYSEISEELKKPLFSLLSRLAIYHLTALCSFLFALWAFLRGKQRWLAWVCLPFGLLSLIMFFIIM